MAVLPVLSSASSCQTDDGGREAGGGSEGEFRALEILYSLFIGRDCDPADTDDPPLSSSGLKLFKATFPGGLLLALASYVDSRGADRMGFSPSRSGGPSKAAPDRTRDLATSLLRSCVKALREDHRQSSAAGKGTASSVLTSLAVADAAAATQLTWHTRLLLEPMMGEARRLHPHPRRTPPAAPRFEDRAGFTSAQDGVVVSRLAVAFADLIRLCSTRALSTATVLDQLSRGGERNADADSFWGTEYISDGVELIRNADSLASLRSALLMASAWTLPACTMKEFGVVLRGFLPGVLAFARARSNKSAADNDVPTANDVVAQPLVVDFLARVLLTCLSDVEKSREEVETTIQTLSRQLATAVNNVAVAEPERAVLAFHNLKCLAAVLLKVERLHEGSTANDIILSAVLQQVGLPLLTCMVRETFNFFSKFPDSSQVKQQVTRCLEVRS
jgi:hypothetical protein